MKYFAMAILAVVISTLAGCGKTTSFPPGGI